MGWAAEHIERLKAGETVKFRPRGGSMSPKIESGQLCTVEPVVDFEALGVGDIVLCRVMRAEYLHLIKAVQAHGKPDERFQIGNNKGRVNGWVRRESIFGKLVEVAP